MFIGLPRAFVSVIMGCHAGGANVSVDSSFQMVPGGVSTHNVGVAGVAQVTLTRGRGRCAITAWRRRSKAMSSQLDQALLSWTARVLRPGTRRAVKGVRS